MGERDSAINSMYLSSVSVLAEWRKHSTLLQMLDDIEYVHKIFDYSRISYM